jgi:hypothetical protein
MDVETQLVGIHYQGNMERTLPGFAQHALYCCRVIRQQINPAS